MIYLELNTGCFEEPDGNYSWRWYPYGVLSGYEDEYSIYLDNDGWQQALFKVCAYAMTGIDRHQFNCEDDLPF